ncbi:protein translocase subunit [Emydomyces testavorans]|uniref:Mitochondrial import inner membrane translocase subunit TIM44 n=1 Tax=Emydomyces testavorans TaxID=2070801 RepID=A0AAF0IPX2_9EURO|nr:protein translocase subunit [Emydomyces testavorans]
MLVAGKILLPGAGRAVYPRGHLVPSSVTSGRSPVYRRSLTQTRLLCHSHLRRPFTNAVQTHNTLFPDFRQVSTCQINLIRILLPARRALQTSSVHWQQQRQKPEEPEVRNTGEESTDHESDEREQKEKDGGDKEKKTENEAPPPPPPPHGDKTPWQVFTETLRSEFKASKEWNESTKALASSANQFTESESVRRARAAYQAASDAASSTTSSALKQTGKAIGKGAAWTWDTPVVKGIRMGVSATGKGIEKATRPVRATKVYKTAVGEMKEVIDDGSSSRYGGWVEKEERRKQRELRELNELKAGKLHKAENMEEDPNAGTNITVHKDAAWKESWREFRDSSRIMQKYFNLKNTYNESENPLISTARSISDRVAGFFAENETAMVIKKFRQMDPNFQIEPFLREMREYILPEVLDAYVKGDTDTLKLWLSDAQFHVYAALAQQYTAAGLKSDGRILDIRHVDISHARMLEPGEVPVFIVTCRTQEVHVYRNAKTNELAAGMEDKVQLVTYAIGVTRIPEDVNNPETRGWRMIELQKSGRDYI